MNKGVFAILLILLGLSVFITHPQLTLLLAFLKVILVVFFYMELRHAHVAWQLGFAGFLLATFSALLLMS